MNNRQNQRILVGPHLLREKLEKEPCVMGHGSYRRIPVDVVVKNW